jgi:hypothetical protein
MIRCKHMCRLSFVVAWLTISRGLVGRGDEGHRTVPCNAASERRGKNPERHPGGNADGQEARVQGQGGGGGEAVEGRYGLNGRTCILYCTRQSNWTRHEQLMVRYRVVSCPKSMESDDCQGACVRWLPQGYGLWPCSPTPTRPLYPDAFETTTTTTTTTSTT